jgi:hypothetical protein
MGGLYATAKPRYHTNPSRRFGWGRGFLVVPHGRPGGRLNAGARRDDAD